MLKFSFIRESIAGDVKIELASVKFSFSLDENESSQHLIPADFKDQRLNVNNNNIVI